jgi:hypothetical protein
VTVRILGPTLVIVLLAVGSPANAQDSRFPRVPGARAGDTVTVVAGRYGAGGLHRALFGSRYRELWTTPIRVPVLDLAREAGGLTPEQVGGGRQTLSLRLRAADGREFAFRSVDKDPAAALPEVLRGTAAEDVVRDQTSAAHPLAGLVATPIVQAAGVAHATPRLFVMPDDPRLGEFRTRFAGLLGTLEERPAEGPDGEPGFAGALDVRSTEKMLEAVSRNPREPVDARAFLAARLLDLYLGDWDRHADQWRWALVPGGRERIWIPIPRDRDQAFSRYDGIVLSLARRVRPELLDFGPKYARPFAATWIGRHLDRRILSELPRGVWDSTARTLQAALTAVVLDEAVSRQPPEYAPEAPRLRATLAARREALPEYAGEVYEMLAKEVDVYASDGSDDVTVTRKGDSTDVWIRTETQARPIFVRRFYRSETDELRIYLGDGRDLARIRGDGGPRVRVVGGGGPDRMIAAPGTGGVKFHDAGDRTEAEGAPLSRRRAPEPPPVRDWGSKVVGDVLLTGSSDFGLVVTPRLTWDRYGFRQVPWARRVRLTVGYSTGQQAARALLEVQDPLESSATVLTLRALASGFETIRFYGIGNGTTDDQPQEFYRVNQDAFELRPGVRFGASGGWRLDIGAAGRVVRTETGGENADRIIGLLEPFGVGTVGRAGLVASLERDTRDKPLGARRGTLLRAAVAEWPATWGDADGAFGSAQLELHGHLTPGDGPFTLAGRGGGRGTWGEAPFDELAFLGGLRSLRGFRENRFAGDQSAFAAGELRMRVTRFRTLVPGEFGVFGAGDVGRVFTTGSGTETWHRSAGGGAYLAFIDRALVLVGGAARSVEGTLFYFGVGFPD